MPSSNDFSAAMAQTSLPWRWMRLGWRWPVSPAEGQKSRPRLPRCLPSTVGPKRKPAIDIVDLSSGASRQGRPPRRITLLIAMSPFARVGVVVRTKV